MHRVAPTPCSCLRRLALAAVAALAGLATTAGAAGASQVPAVQTHLLWSNVSSAEVARQLDELAASGAGMTRVDVGWSSVEPTRKGDYSTWYLDKLDHVVAEAESRGIALLLTFTQTPCWASSAPASEKQGCDGAWWNREVTNYAPTRESDYADALAYLAGRYRGRIAGWEVWNEPNSSYFFRSPNPIRDYAKLVKAAYAPVKAADPATRLVAGSLMHSDVDWVQGLYGEGIKGSFDVLSIHPYSDDRSPLDPIAGQPVRGSFIRGVPAVRDVMLGRGDDKPLWLTEMGWNTSTTRNSDSWRNGVSEARQAEWLELAFDQITRWSYVDVAVWFNLKDNTSDRSDYISNFGLLRHDGTRKPAFASFQRAAGWLEGGTPPPDEDPPPAEDPAPVIEPKIKLERTNRETLLEVSGETPRRSAIVIRITRTRPHGHARVTRRLAVRRAGGFSRTVRSKRWRHGRWHGVALLKKSGHRDRVRI
jgi:polysaccharide biosynthesis protein PslG